MVACIKQMQQMLPHPVDFRCLNNMYLTLIRDHFAGSAQVQTHVPVLVFFDLAVSSLQINDFLNSKIWQTIKECLLDTEKQEISMQKFRLLLELYQFMPFRGSRGSQLFSLQMKSVLKPSIKVETLK
jgi:hypothetical protein